MKKKVLFVCGGISGEHEVSLISCKNVLKALDRNFFEALILFISKKGEMGLAEESELLALPDRPTKDKQINFRPVSYLPYSSKEGSVAFLTEDQTRHSFDVVFSLLHGVGGEDGSIQGFFETARVPMVGSSTRSSAICMDKAMTKRLCLQANLPVVPFQEVRSAIRPQDLQFSFPVFVKPSREGSSLGVSKVKKADELMPALHEARQWGERVMIEPAIEGREIEIAILDDGNSRVISPAGEIVCEKAEFYSYDAKYIDEDAALLIAPAELSEAELSRVQKIASDIFDCLDCKGLARIDFFMTKKGEFLLNEVNTMPGFTSISMFPRLMGLAGVGYSELITRLLG